jgi:hypothetical protein
MHNQPNLTVNLRGPLSDPIAKTLVRKGPVSPTGEAGGRDGRRADGCGDTTLEYQRTNRYLCVGSNAGRRPLI